jgi:hypothetical protein
MRKRLRVQLAVADLFTAPSIELLATKISLLQTLGSPSGAAVTASGKAIRGTYGVQYSTAYRRTAQYSARYALYLRHSYSISLSHTYTHTPLHRTQTSSMRFLHTHALSLARSLPTTSTHTHSLPYNTHTHTHAHRTQDPARVRSQGRAERKSTPTPHTIRPPHSLTDPGAASSHRCERERDTDIVTCTCCGVHTDALGNIRGDTLPTYFHLLPSPYDAFTPGSPPSDRVSYTENRHMVHTRYVLLARTLLKSHITMSHHIVPHSA